MSNVNKLSEVSKVSKGGKIMVWDKPISEIAYKKLKKLVSDIIYDDNKDFDKQAQKLADELWKLSWGKVQLLAEALNIIFTKFKELKEEK